MNILIENSYTVYLPRHHQNSSKDFPMAISESDGEKRSSKQKRTSKLPGNGSEKYSILNKMQWRPCLKQDLHDRPDQEKD